MDVSVKRQSPYSTQREMQETIADIAALLDHLCRSNPLVLQSQFSENDASKAVKALPPLQEVL
jgi:hypothetical protein